jgi:hypothetical protein
MPVEQYEVGVCARCGAKETAAVDRSYQALERWAFISFKAFDYPLRSPDERKPSAVWRRDYVDDEDYHRGHEIICPACADELWAWWRDGRVSSTS